MPDQQAEAIFSALTARGWVQSKNSNSFIKVFETAVGPKDARVSLVGGSAQVAVRTLLGHYESEGCNVLANCSILLSSKLTAAEVTRLAESFAEQADRAVQNSYAARLWHEFGWSVWKGRETASCPA